MSEFNLKHRLFLMCLVGYYQISVKSMNFAFKNRKSPNSFSPSKCTRNDVIFNIKVPVSAPGFTHFNKYHEKIRPKNRIVVF